MYKERILKLQSKLENDEAAFISSAVNRFYFTGFNSSDGYLIITKKKASLFVDFRYFEKAKSVVVGCDVILNEKLFFQIGSLLSDESIKTIFLETGNVDIRFYSVLKKNLSDFEISSDNKIDDEILLQRSIKTKEEIDCIKAAQQITDDAFKYICEHIKAGVSEKDIMLDMEFYMRKLGSEGTAFDFIVVSGKNSSLPHGVPTDKKIEKGDFVTMDFGAVIGGYRSDMTRTVAVGNLSEKQKAVYNKVLEAQREAIKYIRPGAVCSEIDKIARDIIDDAGYKKCFGHALGHSVGLDIHEKPVFSPNCQTVLESGMVITVEPGIYIENEFGVRIEDMVAVTQNGCEDITASEKELIIL